MPLVHTFEENNGIHWCLWKLTEPISFFHSELILNEKEKAIFAAFRLESRKKEFVAARYLWKKQLHVLKPFEYNNIGKPICEDCAISVSHSGDFLAVARSNQQNLGIDIQLQTDKILRIKEKFLSNKELKKFSNSNETLTALWTCKEAIYKCFGDRGVQWNRDIEILNLDSQKALAHYNFLGESISVEISLKRISDLHIAFASL